MGFLKTELVLKDVLFDKLDNNTLIIKFLFSFPRSLHGVDFTMINTIALNEIKKRITFPFVEPDMVAWGDHRCKTLEKTVMISFKDGYGINLGPASYQEATTNYNEAIKTCIASGKADEILNSVKAKMLRELDAQIRSTAPTTEHALKEILANFKNKQKK